MDIAFFMDSSNAAFAACAYLRSGFPGSVQVQLLMTRSRVAPMENTTIPRLELVACEIGSRLAVHIKSMMEFEDIPITLWTVSITALAWIKRDMNWSMFVAGRVKMIRQNSSITDWRHVPGKENPADIPYRGASISQLITTRWWEVPVEKIDMLAKITQFSNYHKILRMVAHWRRFLDWLQRKRSNKITKGPITMEDMTLAEEKVIRLVQQCSFEGVKDKKFKNLRVYEDESGLLWVKCRFVPVEKVDAHSYPMCHAGVQSLHANLWVKCRFVPVEKAITLDKKVEIRSTPIKENSSQLYIPPQASRMYHLKPAVCTTSSQLYVPPQASCMYHLKPAVCTTSSQLYVPPQASWMYHWSTARCMSQTKDACPRRKMHVPDARCMSQTQDACSRRERNDQKRRISWPLGKVEEVLPGADRQIRVARVKTSSGVFLRPVQRLFPLEIKQI
ncbi:hypothetical protein LAZ67_19002029 [Cordylochernes scorpioides]|uniref:DUF5641 domain-containing protein n=1 Tax=Cordylochernes scorpioides TaxID=51811 RepID=A0ABY6LMY3_9ARAC|nr:hypothetical protein LAZ67_19002029 [Cordylochernes scorpioides]